MQERHSLFTPDSRFVRPQRAADLMKAAQAIHQTVYIYADSGYGKTAFIQDYFSHRKYAYYSASDSQIISHLRQLLRRKSSILVLDDLHLLTESEERRQFCAILEQILVAGRTWVILISRCPLPPWLKGLYIQHIFVTIAEKDLELSPSEMDQYFAKWKLSIMPQNREYLESLCRGYPLALRIACLRLADLESDGKDNLQREKEEVETLQQARKDFWDYLESNVYDYWAVELQEFLMDISIVDTFDVQMAQLITKKPHIGRYLSMAFESGNYLTEMAQEDHTFYTLRQAVRMSFRRRLMRRCSQSHIQDLYLSAGSSYELQGKIPEALAMYETCKNEDGISRLLIHNARTYVGAAHYWELRKYYLALSEETILASPELMAGMSILQSILMNDEASDYWYEALRSYADSHTGSIRRSAQARLLSLDIILPHKGISHMASSIKNASLLVLERNTIFPEVSLTNSQPSILNGGKDFCEWSKRDKELLNSLGRALELALGSFGKGMVNLSLAESYFEKAHDSYEVSSLASKGRIQAESGGKLELVFVAVGILSQLSIFNNHLDDALESLESFRCCAAEEAPRLVPSIDALKARFLLYAGQTSDILDWLSQAPDEDREFCTLERYRYMIKARAYLATGKKERALRLLQRMIVYARQRDRIYILMEAQILLAITQYRLGSDVWKETLQQAVSQAESYRFVRLLTREGTALWELLKNCPLDWKDKTFQKKVMSECAHIAELYPAYLSEREGGHVSLSDKALKILRLQAQGMSVAEIADILGLSQAGVKYYNQETYKKLGVNSKAAAITEARNRRVL